MTKCATLFHDDFLNILLIRDQKNVNNLFITVNNESDEVF